MDAEACFRRILIALGNCSYVVATAELDCLRSYARNGGQMPESVQRWLDEMEEDTSDLGYVEAADA